jgi:hypothetical protein
MDQVMDRAAGPVVGVPSGNGEAPTEEEPVSITFVPPPPISIKIEKADPSDFQTNRPTIQGSELELTPNEFLAAAPSAADVPPVSVEPTGAIVTLTSSSWWSARLNVFIAVFASIMGVLLVLSLDHAARSGNPAGKEAMKITELEQQVYQSRTQIRDLQRQLAQERDTASKRIKELEQQRDQALTRVRDVETWLQEIHITP